MRLLAFYLGLLLAAATPAYSETSRAAITVGATVAPHVRWQWSDVPDTLLVSSEDVARGFVEVEAGQLSVQTNDPAGVLLILTSAAPGLVRSAVLQGLDRPLIVGAGGGFQHRPFEGTAPSTWKLRVQIDLWNGAAPGTYAWPLGLSPRRAPVAMR